ncbi:hypothetical protein [Pseudonocardia sp. ICBG601]|uniref:hypothetical protein n=1 Tax=Pseudonocardia sp. ICBG601 TaxID=2846759 RepID=UPI001CF6DFB1|nr:hypothetical protein [Pseudonocardia sp. ICBG601]
MVTKKVRALEKARDEGAVRKAGETWTVEQWLRHWLDTIIAPPTISENAHDAYEVAARVHLIPGIGAHRIDRLEPEHLERLYRTMSIGGAKPGRIHQVHRHDPGRSQRGEAAQAHHREPGVARTGPAAR